MLKHQQNFTSAEKQILILTHAQKVESVPITTFLSLTFPAMMAWL